MMNHTLKKIICLLICTVFLSTLLPITASADTGPKPSVRIAFENMGNDLCYGTLLSKKRSTGPNTVWDGNENHIYNKLIDLDVWRAFVEYEDADGYYFLQIGWQINETKELAWTYYPPDQFKILLYYPETNQYAVSDICERYAFDTYYTVDMTNADIRSVDRDEKRSSDDRLNADIRSVDRDEKRSSDDRLNADKSYRWKDEALSLAARILITIALEMGVALLFGFRKKKALLLLVAVNTVTQIILNILLNLIRFRSGPMAFVAGYIGLEFAVFVMEAVLYAVLMKKFTEKAKPVWFYVVYALVANAVSFGAGLAIAHILPGIF